VQGKWGFGGWRWFFFLGKKLRDRLWETDNLCGFLKRGGKMVLAGARVVFFPRKEKKRNKNLRDRLGREIVYFGEQKKVN